jgi:L-asparaginase / beta-aspartyl-peptidase
VPTLVVHGGAWAIPQENTAATLDGIRDATKAGWEVLNAGGSAVDAVEASVRVLEDNPIFDAGRGSVLTDEGKVEMDACIMDGHSLGAGAVASITAARNPISVARAVMESTDHCLVVGAGADRLVERLGCEVAGDEWLVTPAAQDEYERFKSYSSTVSTLFAAGSSSASNGGDGDSSSKSGAKKEPSMPKMGHDTVGAVAVDVDGNVAAATSTGGVSRVQPPLQWRCDCGTVPPVPLF